MEKCTDDILPNGNHTPNEEAVLRQPLAPPRGKMPEGQKGFLNSVALPRSAITCRLTPHATFGKPFRCTGSYISAPSPSSMAGTR